MTLSPEQYRLDAERRRERRSQTPVSILDLFDGYAREREPAPATVKAWRRQLSAFVAFSGHDDATKVTPEDVVAWKDHLLHKAGKSGTGLSAKTVGETYLSALKTTFRWAVENRRLAKNPAATARVRGAKRVHKRERGAFLRRLDAPDFGAVRNLLAYRTRLLQRPSFAPAVDEARRFRQYFPLGAPDRD